jgi:hypothetical protein
MSARLHCQQPRCRHCAACTVVAMIRQLVLETSRCVKTVRLVVPCSQQPVTAPRQPRAQTKAASVACWLPLKSPGLTDSRLANDE